MMVFEETDQIFSKGVDFDFEMLFFFLVFGFGREREGGSLATDFFLSVLI